MQKSHPYVRYLATLAGVAALGSAEATPQHDLGDGERISVSAPKAELIGKKAVEQNAASHERVIYTYYRYIIYY